MAKPFRMGPTQAWIRKRLEAETMSGQGPFQWLCGTYSVGFGLVQGRFRVKGTSRVGKR